MTHLIIPKAIRLQMRTIKKMTNRHCKVSKVTLAAVAVFGFAATLPSLVFALEIDTNITKGLWVTPGAASYHFKRGMGYNERNYGLGFEYRINDDYSAVVGTYRNSIRDHSTYVAVGWQPLRISQVRVGVLGGVINGYKDANNGGYIPLILPVASYEYKRVGINMTYIPSITGKVHGALAFQFKYNFSGA